MTFYIHPVYQPGELSHNGVFRFSDPLGRMQWMALKDDQDAHEFLTDNNWEECPDCFGRGWHHSPNDICQTCRGKLNDTH